MRSSSISIYIIGKKNPMIEDEGRSPESFLLTLFSMREVIDMIDLEEKEEG